jgi:hypothetical protein
MRASLALVVLVMAMCYSGNSQAVELNLDFKLVNSTGFTIKEFYIAPSSEEEWGDNILAAALKDGGELDIEFHPKAKATKWDFMIVKKDGKKIFWKGYKLTEIETITLMYDEDTGKATAKAE